MPTQKDLKRLVRRRMQKTGESYTAARAQFLKSDAPTDDRLIPTNGSAPASRATKPSRAAKPDYAKLAGMSDKALEAATGCRWEKWVKSLDYVEAHTWPHRKIAEYLHEKYQVTGWWAQGITVGYERIRGLRAIGQRRGGSFEASKSRTFAVPVATLFDAFAVARKRSRWLAGHKLTVRAASPPKSMRITWADGTSVEAWFLAKGAGKSSVSVAHRKLASAADVARAKAFWAERFGSLAELLESS